MGLILGTGAPSANVQCVVLVHLKYLSPKRRQKRVKIKLPNGTKYYNTSSCHILLGPFCEFCLYPSSLKKKKLLKETDPPRVIFARPWSTPLQIWTKTTNLVEVENHEYFIPSKFRNHPLSGSREKAEYVFSCMYMHVCKSPPPHLKNSSIAQI